MADRIVESEHVGLSLDGGVLTEEGAAFLRTIGVDIDGAAARSSRERLLCRPCLDWSERRPHIAGAVGAALLPAYLANGWVRRLDGSRVVLVTPSGRQALDRAFSLDNELWAAC